MKQRWIFLMIKGTAHKDRYHKHLTTKKTKIHKQKSEEIQGRRKKYSDILTFLWEYFVKCRKNKNRSILNYVLNNLNVIDFYLY